MASGRDEAEIDSDIMSEHNDDEYKNFNNKKAHSNIKIPKPRNYSMQFKNNMKGNHPSVQDTVKTKDKANLPKKQTMDFTIQSSPFDNEDARSKRLPELGTDLF